MSADEMREYCLGLVRYNLRVEIRLKNASEVMTGKISDVEAERFHFVGDDDVVQIVRYAWVARIKNT